MSAPQTCQTEVVPDRPPAGFAGVVWWARLFFKAWTTPQRICGCKKSRW
jgi:hypothetical protein